MKSQEFPINKRIRSKLSRKNQLTLPVDAQKALGTRPESEIDFIIAKDGRVYIETAPLSLEDTYGSVRSDYASSLDWKEAERIAKDEHAKHVLDEMNRG